MENIKDGIVDESCTKEFHPLVVDKSELESKFNKLDEIKEKHKNTSTVKQTFNGIDIKGADHYNIKEGKYDGNNEDISYICEIYSNKNSYKKDKDEYILKDSRFPHGIKQMQDECELRDPNSIVKELVAHSSVNEVEHYNTKTEKYDANGKNTYKSEKVDSEEGLFEAHTVKYKLYGTQTGSEQCEVKDSKSFVRELVNQIYPTEVDDSNIKKEMYGDKQNTLSDSKNLYKNETDEYNIFEDSTVKLEITNIKGELGLKEPNSSAMELVTNAYLKEDEHYNNKVQMCSKDEINIYDNEKIDLDKDLVAVDTFKYDTDDIKLKKLVEDVPHKSETKYSKYLESIVPKYKYEQGNSHNNTETDILTFSNTNFSKTDTVSKLKENTTCDKNEQKNQENKKKEKKNQEKTYECATCGKSFNQRNKLTDHFRKHRSFLFTCSQCHFSTPNRSTLVRHSKTHLPMSQRTRKTCLVCESSYSTQHYLNGHMKIHSDVCQSSFSTQHNLNRHMKIHSDVQDRPYKCPTCNFTCTSSYVLKNHIARHTGERPYQCSTCYFSTSRRHSLITHLEIHEGYQCKLCTSKYACSKQLKSHLEKVHSLKKDENEYKKISKLDHKCTICNKFYSHKCRLEVHMQTHTGKRPFTCAECQKTFATKGILRSHISVVHLKTPFNCSYCEFTTFNKFDFRKHVQHHGRNRFQCAHCSFSTDLRHCIAKHFKVHSHQ